MCFLNADNSYVHKNKSFRSFGSYGDILVRNRKMYVAPTPFALADGTAHHRVVPVIPRAISRLFGGSSGRPGAWGADARFAIAEVPANGAVDLELDSAGRAGWHPHGRPDDGGEGRAAPAAA